MKHCFGNVQYDLQYITNYLTTVCHRLATFINTRKQELVASHPTDSIRLQRTSSDCRNNKLIREPCGVTHRKSEWYLCLGRTSLSRSSLQALW